MAAFQIMITPPPKKDKAKSCVTVDKEEAIPRLVLAPFNPTPEIIFGNVPINSKVVKSFIVFNPTDLPANFYFANMDESADRIGVSEEAICLKGKEEKTIDISWAPFQSVAMRKVIRVIDSTRSCKSFEIIITGTCSEPNKGNKRGKGTRPQGKKVKPWCNDYKKGGTMVPKEVRRETYNVTVSNKENIPCQGNQQHIPCSLNSQPERRAKTTFKELLQYSPNVDPYSDFKLNLDEGEITKLSRRSTLAISNEYLPKVESNNAPFVSFIQDGHETSVQTEFFHSAENIPLPISDDSLESKDTVDVEVTPFKAFIHDNALNSFLEESEKEEDDHFKRFKTSSPKDRTFDKFICVSPPKVLAKKTPKHCFMSPKAGIIFALFCPHYLGTSVISTRKKVIKPKKLTENLPLKRKAEIFDFENALVTPVSLKSEAKKINQTEDPFLKMSLFYGEVWVNKQEKDVLKWLNSMLNTEICEERGEKVVDAAEIWVKSSRNAAACKPLAKDVFAATLYHAPQNMDSLRKAAANLYASDCVRNVLMPLNALVERKIIAIREDRDLHLDVGLRTKLQDLLLCYNPLWLRIGLETLFGERIEMQHVSDTSGLVAFIRKRVLANDDLNRKQLHPGVVQMKNPNFGDTMKKFILNKFLTLVFFLDVSKMHKLVRQDPCLFVKQSSYKSSKNILLTFCSDLVTGHGDYLKELKDVRYILSYKQTGVDEYDYAVSSMGDLRNGACLARAFEILFGRNDLCNQLRVPAISILQKIHNVQVAFKAAQVCCKVEGNITPKDIVMGHREKTLSFLWQIVHNYLTPLYEKAAARIQKWWKRKLLWHRSARFLRELRMKSAAAVRIQRWYRRSRVTRIEREEFLKLREKTTIVQRKFRANQAMKKDEKKYKDLKKAAIIVQERFRARKAMEFDRKRYDDLRKNVVLIQRKFRRKMAVRSAKETLENWKKAAVCIQRKFRAKELGNRQKLEFQTLKRTTVFVQRKFRAGKAMELERNEFLKMKKAAIFIQSKFRARKAMKLCRKAFEDWKKAAVFIQTRFRAIRARKIQKSRYGNLKKAAVAIQTRFRARKAMELQRKQFEDTKKSVVFIQRKFRARKAMELQRKKFRDLKNAAVFIQRKFKARKAMELEKGKYETLKKSVIFIQRKFRGNEAMKRERLRYEALVKATITIQRKFRGKKATRFEKMKLETLKQSTLFIQQKFRATLAMKKQRSEYRMLVETVVLVQRRFRAKKEVELRKKDYEKLRESAVLIQRKFRATKSMKLQRERFLKLKAAAISIQRKWRGNVAMKGPREEFFLLRKAVISVQRKFRAKVCSRQRERELLALEQARQDARANKVGVAATKIQALWRGFAARKEYEKMTAGKRSANISPEVSSKGTLEQRYMKSIFLLKTNDMYNVVTKCLWELDIVTELSPRLCEEISREGIVDIVFNLLNCGNRSEPSLNMYRYGLGILLNLARHKPTKQILWEAVMKSDAYNIFLLLRLMIISQNKFNCPVFLYATTFLWCLAQEEEMATVIANVDSFKKQLDNMVQKLKCKQTKQRGAKGNRHSSPAIMPKVFADWYSDVKLFQDHFHAARSLYKSLYSNDSAKEK